MLLPSVLTCSMYLALSTGTAGPRDLSHTRNVVPINKVSSAGWSSPQHNILERSRVVAPAVGKALTKICEYYEVIAFLLGEECTCACF